MANKHYGNLADVFKHVALAEILTQQKPAEYWESHAGSAFYEESADIPTERLHGVHTFFKTAADFDASKRNAYYQQLVRHANSGRVAKIPGSPSLALSILGENVRRFLFCDLESDSLVSIRQLSKNLKVVENKIECVQDDGVMLLRGAGLTVSEQWTASTFAFIDPYDPTAASDAAGITPIDLWCELANRGIACVLFYGYGDGARRTQLHHLFTQAIDKHRLKTRPTQYYEGTLKVPSAPDLPTLWGFGLLTINLREPASTAADRQLRALEAAYATASLSGCPSGAWKYSLNRP